MSTQYGNCCRKMTLIQAKSELIMLSFGKVKNISKILYPLGFLHKGHGCLAHVLHGVPLHGSSRVCDREFICSIESWEVQQLPSIQ